MTSFRKMRRMTFTEVDIRHRMAPLWILHYGTLAFILKVKHFHVMHSLKKTQAADDYGIFASTRTSPAAVEFHDRFFSECARLVK